MVKDDNPALYYRRREEQERALAGNAPDTLVRKIHLELAEGYATKAQEGISAGKSRSHLRAVPNS